jgi:GH25 family lysozyme M1 (1,4-beta-N-acetylmuramidase)
MLHRVTIPPAAVIGAVAVTLSLAAVPGAGAVVTERASGPVRGMDISSYQHAGTPIDWAVLATHGIRFVAIKASEGTYYLNPYYASDATHAAAAGLLVMPYVFANPGRDGGVATANFAARTVGTRGGLARLPLVVDLENDPYKRGTDCYGLRIPAMIAWIAGFTRRASALTGQWPTIYTTTDWWRECTGSTHRFPHDPLWLAAFGSTAPVVPSPWQTWTFWQYNNAGSLPGIGNTDLDYYQPTDGLPALRAPAAAASAKKPGKKHAAPAKSKRHKKAKAKAKGETKGKHKGKGETKSKTKGRHKGKGETKGKHKHKHKSKHKQAKRKSKPKPKKHKAHHRAVSSRYRGKG